MTGDQEIRLPFFHHGDLVVKGQLDRTLLFARLRSGEPVFRTGDAAAR
ncbi:MULTISPECIES: hypothetical protein [unclassified Streptomyces]